LRGEKKEREPYSSSPRKTTKKKVEFFSIPVEKKGKGRHLRFPSWQWQRSGYKKKPSNLLFRKKLSSQERLLSKRNLSAVF